MSRSFSPVAAGLLLLPSLVLASVQPQRAPAKSPPSYPAVSRMPKELSSGPVAQKRAFVAAVHRYTLAMTRFYQEHPATPHAQHQKSRSPKG